MTQTIQYKGYDVSVLYSAEDRLPHGKIPAIRDIVIYEAPISLRSKRTSTEQ